MTKPSSILVVDDSLVMRMIHSAALKKNFPDAYVETAVDGLDAMQQLGEFKFELVVTDNQMPGKDGVDLVREMRTHADTANTRIIGASSSEMSKEFKAAGADGFYQSGTDTADLIAAIEEIFPPEA